MSGLVRRPLVIWLLAALAVPVLLTAVLIPARAGSTEDDASTPAPTLTPTPAPAPAPVGETPTPSGSGTPTPSESSAPQGDVPAFEVGRTDRSIRVQAPVRSQAVKDAIAAEVDTVLGPDREYDDRTTISADGLPDASALAPLLRALAIGTGDASVRYDGETVTLSGQVPDQATKATVARAAATAVPGAVVAGELELPAPPKSAVSEPCRTFPTRLAEFTRRYPINFLSGASIVNDASKPAVAKAAAVLTSCPTVRVEIAGHTDNLGSPRTSLPLSERRAAALKTELVRRGIDPHRIVANGYGEAFPIASNATGEGRIANRRAEIRVLQGN